jgi:homoserine dehydrogenase
MLPPLRVGLAGLGTVGAAVINLLDRQAEALGRRLSRKIEITGVSARDRLKPRGFDPNRFPWFDDPLALANSASVDVFIELIGGLAEGKGVALAFEASVAGGIPIVKTLREGLAGNSIGRIYGILNGTCNYILSNMETKALSFAECLADAQRLGYAEADPTFDVGGYDTAHKLAILASLAFGTVIDAKNIAIEGIESISLADIEAANELGYRIKLLGVAQKTSLGVESRVHPTMVSKSSALAQVMGVTNAVTIDADAVHQLTLVGPGAGGEATASAIIADIADIARGVRTAPFGLPIKALNAAEPAPMQLHEGGYYIRLSVHDRPGAAAAIAARMAELGISLESIVQRRRPGEHMKQAGAVPVVLITYATYEKTIRQALQAVVTDGYIAEKPQLIRIERE